jgi:hypothetical protein
MWRDGECITKQEPYAAQAYPEKLYVRSIGLQLSFEKLLLVAPES